MSERQLAAVCHCNTLAHCVSESSLTLFLQTDRHMAFLRRQAELSDRERGSCMLSLVFRMQLSAPHGSIVILSGRRLFWIVCEARWVTEFTLTHACNIINLCARTQNMARTGADKLTQTYAHQRGHSQHSLAWQAKPPVGLGSPPSSTEQNSQGSRLEEGTQCVSTLSPAKVSVSGDGSSQQLARLELSECWLQAAGCLVLPGILEFSSHRENLLLPHKYEQGLIIQKQNKGNQVCDYRHKPKGLK